MFKEMLKEPAEEVLVEDPLVNGHKPEPEPVKNRRTPGAPDARSAAELLDDHVQWTRKFVVLPNEEAYDGLALWCLYTYVWREFRFTPYLRFSSSEMRSGKTRVLETAIEPWCARPIRSVGGSSAAYIRHAASRVHPVLLIDESDGWMADPDKSEAIKGILNSGFAKGKPYGLMLGMEPVELDVFCPKVVAGIGAVSETVEDRSIKVPMRRKRRQDHVTPWDSGIAKMLEDHAARWRLRASWWAAEADRVDSVRPTYPDVVYDRVRDVWHPLFVVAALAGGDWPEKVSKAAQVLERPRIETERIHTGNLVLRDLKDLWVEQGKPDHLGSMTAVNYLNSQQERPWADSHRGMTPHKLGKLLKEYGCEPAPWQHDNTTTRGYPATQLEDAWSRYTV